MRGRADDRRKRISGRSSLHGRLLLIAGLLVVLGAREPPALARPEPGWTLVTTEDGIEVTAREVPGRGFPTFRGVGVIYSDIYQVLAVMADTRRHCEWMDRCAAAKQLRKISEREYIVYSRTDVPWPIADRDAVFHSVALVDVKRRNVEIRFTAVTHPSMPPVDGVVRMTDLRGHYKMQALAIDRTRVEFQVDADPKGLLPKWLAKMATRRLPLYTIRDMRKQVNKTRGWYAERIKRWMAGKY